VTGKLDIPVHLPTLAADDCDDDVIERCSEIMNRIADYEWNLAWEWLERFEENRGSFGPMISLRHDFVEVC
jgi:hypothetical protein